MHRMHYQIAATALALIHFAFILFVILGGLLVLKWPRLMWVHIPAAVWGALIEFGGWWCPLTKWENVLLREAGRAGYSGGFVAHYIMPVIYPPGLTRGMEIVLGVIVLVINISVYVRVFR
jgi:hypothetical protein